MTKTPIPLIIIGLDGATRTVLDPLSESGTIPTLTRLLRNGLTTQLRSTLPVATLPAWTSFMTGAEPASHGITDIFMRRGSSYGLQPSSGAMRRIPTIMQRLSTSGYRVASLGIPGTYPPEPLNGICVSGFDAPGASRTPNSGIWPPEATELINRPGGWRFGVFNEHASAARRFETATDSLLRDIEIKERIILDSFSTQPWDLFFFHIQATDTASHHLWHTWDRNSPRACAVQETNDLPRVFQRVDVLLEKLLALAPEDTRVLIVSDHGFGGASDRAVYLNRWLHEQGHLRFQSPLLRTRAKLKAKGAKAIASRIPAPVIRSLSHRAPAFIRERLLSVARDQGLDFRNTHAFSHELDYAPSLWMNRRSIFENGGLSDEEALARAERIRADLLQLKDPQRNTKLIDRIHLRHELPQGEASLLLPDLVIEPSWANGYRASFLLSNGPGPWIRTLSPDDMNAPRGHGMPGVHHRDGIFVAHGPGLPALPLPVLTIAQAGALIYPLMGLPIPVDIECQPPDYLEEILPLTRATANARSLTQNEQRPPMERPEQRDLIKRLEDLGYLE